VKKKILGLLLFSFVITGCADPVNANEQQIEKTFEIGDDQYTGHGSYFINVLTDNDTGVQYLVVNSNGRIAITPRLNRNGVPHIP
jgi:hypothetical protein